MQPVKGWKMSELTIRETTTPAVAPSSPSSPSVVAKLDQLEYETRLIDYDWRMATAFAKSGVSGMWKTQEAIFTAIQIGRRYGWTPVHSLQNLYPLQGSAHFRAISAMGLVLPHADKPPRVKRETKDGRPYSCTVIYTRKGVKTERTFSMEDAANAGLVKSAGSWAFYAENMLFWRAGMFAAREAFPDILSGIYAVEEVANMSAEEYERGALKDITPESGTGLRDQLDAISLDGISDPQDKQPDPDTLVSAEGDRVEPEIARNDARPAHESEDAALPQF
jgi:hypothetical protein